MTSQELLNRITINPNMAFGKPTIRGLRYSVEWLLETLSSGMTNEEILADYEDLEPADIQAVLLYAARLSQADEFGSRMNPTDLQHLRTAIEVARQARENGNHPFGAILVDEKDQVLLQAENSVVTDKDCTGHAETNLMRLATQHFLPEKLAICTLYTSTEPCAMCAGAIHWGNVRRVVYALSEVALYEIIGPSPEHLLLPCREVFAHSQRHVEVEGPALELAMEARAVHAGFWQS